MSPATAFVLVSDTRIVGVASFVELAFVNRPTTPPTTSSVTVKSIGAFGAVVSIVVVKLLDVLLTLPAISVILALSV